MWTPADIEAAVVANPQAAADALAALQLNSELQPLDPAGLAAMAPVLGGGVGHAWVTVLAARQQLGLFVGGLVARGVAIDMTADDGDDAAGTDDDATPARPVPSQQLARFFGRVANFHCLVKSGGKPAGSGTLIGPSHVLTAWHVVASADAADHPLLPDIEIELSNGFHVDAFLPPVKSSQCTAEEFAGLLPDNDTALTGRCDYAVLKLARPVGALMGSADLPPHPAAFKRLSGVYVVHYPKGANPGVGAGSMSGIKGISLRWGHTVKTEAGSSGGGCFDETLTIAGIHQGRNPRGRGRLVPTSCFYTDVAGVVASDAAPLRMWSLDGTPEGEFVIGRQGFFEAFAEARKDGRVRGIRTRRSDPSADLGGLPFTFRMFERMIARDTATRHVRLSFEVIVTDLAADIARRAIDAGIPVVPVEPRAGVADGQSAPEAVGADRGRRIATALNDAAHGMGIQLWLFVDHPQVAFGDEIRSALEGFVDQLLKEPDLRIVIAGFEAVAMPGQEFTNAVMPASDIATPGLVSDFIGSFTATEVESFIRDAAASAGREVSTDLVEKLVDDALAGLAQINGSYRPWLAGQAGTTLRPDIRKLFAPQVPR